MWKNKAETLFFSDQQWRHDPVFSGYLGLYEEITTIHKRFKFEPKDSDGT